MKFNYYPNPVEDKLNLTFAKDEFTELFVYDVTGKCIINISVVAEETSKILDFGSLKAGIGFCLQSTFENKVYKRLCKLPFTQPFSIGLIHLPINY